MKPILFNSQMVRAILEGRKTVTRRVVRPQPEGRPVPMTKDSCWPGYFAIQGTEKVVRPPYQPDDILWVRETFRVDYLSNIPGAGRVQYKDETYMDIRFNPDRYDMMRRAQRKPGWRSNENMPREAARIFLKVTDVRVEKLQAMGHEDAEQEGCWCDESGLAMPLDKYAEVWDRTIKPADLPTFGWAANPWVWVIEFERTGPGGTEEGGT